MSLHNFAYVAALSLAALPVSADEGLTAPPVEENAVRTPEPTPEKYESLVSTRREGETSYTSPVSTNIVDQNRLNELLPRNAAEALRYQPGVWVQQTGLVGGAPIIRGFMGNQVLYLFDGVRRNTASLFPGANSYLNNTDPWSIQRVEVLRGPSSVLYGSDGIGGVVNVMNALAPTFTPFARAYGRLGLELETADVGMLAGGTAGYSDVDNYVRLSGSWDAASGLRGGALEGVMTPTDYHQGGLNLQLAHHITAADTLEVLAQYFRRPYASRYDNPTWVQKDERQLYVLRYRGGSGGLLGDTQLSLYYQRQQSDIHTKYWGGHAVDHSLGFDAQSHVRLDGLALSYGAHYHRDFMYQEDPQNVTQTPYSTWDNPALFILADVGVIPNVTLQGSLRGDFFLFKSSAPPPGVALPAGMDAANTSQSHADFALTGGIGATVAITPELNWVTQLGTAFRAPNRNDYLADGAFTLGYDVPPSGSLKPERSWNVETGLRSNSKYVELQVDGFYTYMDNIILSKPTTYQGSSTITANYATYDVYSMFNVASANVAGVEVGGTIHLLPVLSLYGNGTYVYGRRSDNQPLDYVFPLNGTAGLRWQDQPQDRRFYAEFEVFGAAKTNQIISYVASSDPAYRNNPQDSASGSILQNGYLPGFALLNARLGAKLAEYVDVFVALDNLTNQRYRMKDTRLDGPGFNARVGVFASY